MSATAVRPLSAMEAHRCTVRAVVMAYEQGYEAGFHDEEGPVPYGFGTLEAVAWSEGWLRGAADAHEDAQGEALAALGGGEEGDQ